MTSINFESKLEADGFLQVPEEAVNELGLHPGDILQVKIECSNHHGEEPVPYISAPAGLSQAIEVMTQRTPEQIATARARAIERYKPRRTVPSGQTLADIVGGKWPGNETDTQITTALEELS